MKLDPSKYYRMPLIMGPMFDREPVPSFTYPHVEVLAFQYLTSADAIAPLLPQCYRPAEEPLATVFFSHNSGLHFMAGAGYRMVTFQVAARFDGEQDHVEGDYILGVFEDRTWPILCGREDLGVPKLFADISPIKQLPDLSLRCEASLWGHFLFGLDVPAPKAQPGLVRRVAARRINARPWLAYKYIPSLDGPPDADYPTITQNDNKIEQLWLAKSAGLRFGNAKVEDIGQVRTLLDALATLPVVQPLRALHYYGSAVLRYDLSRRLR
jgi:acetoacetate decarboxylase